MSGQHSTSHAKGGAGASALPLVRQARPITASLGDLRDAPIRGRPPLAHGADSVAAVIPALYLVDVCTMSHATGGVPPAGEGR
jgi:hypothetical protein